MKTELAKIKELSSDPANVRKHDDRNLDSIKASLKRFGQQKPIVVDGKGIVVAGNGTLDAAKSLGWKEIQIVRTELVGADAVAYAIADNRTAELAIWDDDALAQTLASLKTDESIDELVTGFTEQEIDDLIGKNIDDIEEDEVPELPEEAVTQVGDLWLLGEHRLLCGDTTDSENVARLVGDASLVMLHADPPYGMGKEKDGIANDNLYAEKLDKFQMQWWNAWRTKTADNGSAYVWGNAPDLWRLWYQGGLQDSERLTMRNEIVWAKGSAGAGGISHIGYAGLRLYPQETERCLFFMVGEQGFNNNADNYWEGWDGILHKLQKDCDAMGWTSQDIKRICGVGMYCHWFTESQWRFIPEEHYKKLQAEAKKVGEHDAFKREHDAFKREHDELKREHDELKREFYATRAFFNNTHDNMTDVWQFERVSGEERHGHATPKPVEMVARAIKSSSDEGDAVGVPFAGTCPELIACEQLNRKCYGMEIDPLYCDVIVKRWENLTGEKAERIPLQETPRNSKNLQETQSEL